MNFFWVVVIHEFSFVNGNGPLYCIGSTWPPLQDIDRKDVDCLHIDRRTPQVEDVPVAPPIGVHSPSPFPHCPGATADKLLRTAGGLSLELGLRRDPGIHLD
jgi:hypothetical protein